MAADAWASGCDFETVRQLLLAAAAEALTRQW